MTQFPVLLCIPHGGTKIPPELEDRVQLSKHDLIDDIDAYTGEIYDLGDKVFKVISSDYARTFIDMNRNIGDLPPEKPDGIVKSMTCYKKPVYRSGMEPDAKLIEELIDKYYKPYHMKILSATRYPDLEMALDCHSMAAVAPEISPDVGEKRPIICLGNSFGESCSMETTEKLAGSFRKALDLNEDDLKINKPFHGKYTTHTYGNKPVPWIHVELNRDLFLKKPWYDPESFTIDKSRLQDLNKMFEKTLKLFFD